MPPGGDRVKVSKNLGATSVATVAPVVTSLGQVKNYFGLIQGRARHKSLFLMKESRKELSDLYLYLCIQNLLCLPICNTHTSREPFSNARSPFSKGHAFEIQVSK